MATTYTNNYSLTEPGYTDEADIQVLNANTVKIDTLIHENRSMIADSYDSTKTYAVGDVVIQEGILYKCITAIETAESFDATKWETTTAVQSGSGVSDVSITPTLSEGTKIAEYTVNGESGVLYAPEGGSSSGGSGGSFKLLWTNPNPTTAVESLDPDIDVSGYDEVGIVFSVDTNGTTTSSSVLNMEASDGQYFVHGNAQSSVNQIQGRVVNISSGKITFQNGIAPGVGYDSSYAIPYKIYGIKYGSSSSQISYSTEEQDTGLTWIDGKKIYQKTWTNLTTTEGTTTWRTLLTDDSVSTMDKFINVTGLFKQENIAIGVYKKSDTELQFTTLTNNSVDTVTIQYTKTTDTSTTA